MTPTPASNTERPIVRAFKGLVGLEALVVETSLQVRCLGREPEILRPYDACWVAAAQVCELGLRLEIPWLANEVAAACAMADLTPQQVRVCIIAEDRFLKERVVLGEWPIADVPAPCVITESGQARERAMSNPFEGFTLLVAIVLAEEQADHRPRRPHRKGTILASATFSVRVDRSIGGLDPKRLDAQTREDHDLPAATLIFVEVEDELLEAEDIGAVLSIYINENLYDSLGRSRTHERSIVLRQLAMDAWFQVIHRLSAELPDGYTWEEHRGALMRSLFGLTKKVRKKLTEDEFIQLLGREPNKLCALISASGRQVSDLVTLVEPAEETET